ncbi:DNA-binding protein [Novispirillum itersonii]|uniref:DNA-binding protein n=1 Tax=Novispirillum itersonii TaxID=189 RepID=UPI00146E6339|nr:DNA-binding protein [Novispirillum itersonii]
MARVTFDAIAAAADRIIARGDKPSVRKVREELGGGSPNDILPHLQNWREGRTGPSVEAGPCEIPPRLERYLAEISQGVLGAFMAILREERQEQGTATLQTEYDAKRSGPPAAQVTALQAERDALLREMKDLRQALLKAEARAQDAEAAVQRLQSEMARQMMQLQAAHTAVDADRRDQMVRLEAKLAAARQELRAVKEGAGGR